MKLIEDRVEIHREEAIMRMTVSDLARELLEYEAMGMGDEVVTVVARGNYAHVERTEPGDGLEGVYILDKDTP